MTYREAVLANAPVLYWALDERASLVRDISGAGRDGALSPAPLRPQVKAPGYLEATWNMGSSGGYSYYRIVGPASYTPAAGDVLEYGIKWTQGPVVNKQMGLDCYFSNGWVLRQFGGSADQRDQNGLGPHPATDLSVYATNTWYDRKIPLSPYAGTPIITWWLVCEADTIGQYVGQFREMRITNAGATRFTIYSNNDPSITNPVAPSYDTGGSGTPGNHTGSISMTSLVAFKALNEGGIKDTNERSVGDKGSTFFARAGEADQTAYRVERSAADLPAGDAQRTVECWVFPLDSNGGYLACYGPPAGTPGQSFLLSSQRVGLDRIIFRDGVNSQNSIAIPDASAPAVGKWSHFAFTIADQNWTCYVNGTSVGAGTFTVPIDTLADGTLFTVGQRQDLSTTDVQQGTWQGRIAQVAVYPVALPSQTIAAHFRAGLRESVVV